MTMTGLRDGSLRQALLIFYDYLHRATLVSFHQDVRSLQSVERRGGVGGGAR